MFTAVRLSNTLKVEENLEDGKLVGCYNAILNVLEDSNNRHSDNKTCNFLLTL